MNDKSKSAYGTSFFIRMGVLLLLLLIVGGGVAYDRFVLVPAGEQAVKRVMEACKDPQADRASVYKAAGCDPTSVESSGPYKLEDWTFGRILPNLESYKVGVVFQDDKVAEVISGGITDKDRATFK